MLTPFKWPTSASMARSYRVQIARAFDTAFQQSTAGQHRVLTSCAHWDRTSSVLQGATRSQAPTSPSGCPSSAHASTSSPIPNSSTELRILDRSPVKFSSLLTASPSTSGISPGDCATCLLLIRTIPHPISSCCPRLSVLPSQRCPSSLVGREEGTRSRPSPAHASGTTLKGVHANFKCFPLESRILTHNVRRCQVSTMNIPTHITNLLSMFLIFTPTVSYTYIKEDPCTAYI
jgi:hypothetical protein